MKKPSNTQGKSDGSHNLSRDPRLTLDRKPLPIPGAEKEDDEGFELRFLEEVLAQDPCHEEALMLLGHAYTRQGDYERGRQIDERLTRLRPADPTAFYNLACSHSLLGQLDEAVTALARAVSLGYRDLAHILKDPDLVQLRRDPRFPDLVSRMPTGRAADS